MDIVRAMRLLVPPAWQNNPQMDDDLRAFFDFNSMHMEPWDGPAGIVLSDGRYAACTLDRNGLRPARYVITTDNIITCASEIGIWDYQPDEVLEKGRVGPGELMVIDTYQGRILHSAETDEDLKRRHPYKLWLERNVKRLIPFEQLPEPQATGERALMIAYWRHTKNSSLIAKKSWKRFCMYWLKMGRKPPARWEMTRPLPYFLSVHA